MRPALLQERGIKMTTTNRISRTRRKRNTGTLNVKINACQECGNKKPLLKVWFDKNFFIKCENCGNVLYGSIQDGILETVKKWNARNSGK